jgi:hypothetical protein
MKKSVRSQAASLGALLEEFVRERRYVSEHAQVIDSLDELPLRLQTRAQSVPAGAQWRAWSDEHRIRFIVGERVRIADEQAREITLKITFYDHDGVLAASGVWLRRVTGNWVLCSVLDDKQVDMREAAPYGRLALAS